MTPRTRLVALFLSLLLACASSAALAVTPFQNGPVDVAGNVGQHSSLALDADGNPHIAYYDATNADLRYAVRSGSAWTFETVDATGDMGQYCALALDSYGNPHISYYDATNQDLRYATKSGEVWTRETVDATLNAGLYTSITLDATNTPHIAYRGFTGLRYTTKSGGVWTFANISVTGDIDGTSIKLDSGGYPRIAYHDFINKDLDYAQKTEGGWQTRIIADGGAVYQGITLDYGRHPSLAIDGHDLPHISHAGSYGIQYSYINTIEQFWYTEALDSTETLISYTSIALDPQGVPHIAYTNWGRNDLDYMSKTISGWAKDLLDADDDVGDFPSLAMDAQGNPSIAYYDISNGNLKLADSAVHLLSPRGGERWDTTSPQTVRWSGSGPVDIQMSTDGGLSYFTVLPAVSGGTAAITVPNLNSATAKVRIVRYSPFSTSASPGELSVAPGLVNPWWNSIVDNTPFAGNHATSLALDANGNPKIAYQDDTNGRLKYATKTGGVWNIEDVALSGTQGIFTGVPFASLALNSLGNPGIAYFDIVPKTLRYASKSGGVWTTQAIDNTGNADQFCSLAFDAMGNPRVSYLDATTGSLFYGARSGGIWTTERADFAAGIYVGAYNSLALDAQGNPHIAYANFTAATLRYASKSGAAWIVETVTPAGAANAAYISLALDPQDNPHISYYDASKLNLKYASKVGGVWIVETVDPTFGVGDFTTLRLDAEGRPHIGYYDQTNGRLMHAWKSGSIWAREIVDAPSGTGGSGGGSVGQYASLALDVYMNPRISYYDNGNGILKYASSAFEANAPLAGVTWPVGAVRSADWSGMGRADIWLSTDGGLTWMAKQGQATGGHFSFTVPHTPSHFCKVGIGRGVPYSLAITDSFFTIQTSVQLLALLAAPVPNGGRGTLVSWNTDPGPADLGGYRLERSSAPGSGAWQTIAPLTRETNYTDADGAPGTRYRLFAVNGLGEELYLGEVSSRPAVPLAAWPIPYRAGDMTVAFATASGLGGAAGRTDVGLYDVQGRLVRMIATGMFVAGYRTANWDGKDQGGHKVGAGVYFIRSESGGHVERMKLVVLR